MAGRPLARAIAAEITRRGTEQGESPLEYICSWLAAGQSLSKLSRELGVSQQQMSKYANGLPDSRPAIAAARQEGAHAMVDSAHQLLDDVEPDRDHIAIAKAKVDLIMWHAERLNQTEFGGQKAQVNVNIMNVGSLSLDAMRTRSLDKGTSHTRVTHIAEPIGIDTSIVEDAIVLSDDDTTT